MPVCKWRAWAPSMLLAGSRRHALWPIPAYQGHRLGQQAGRNCVPDTHHLCCQIILPCPANAKAHCQGLALSVLCWVG